MLKFRPLVTGAAVAAALALPGIASAHGGGVWTSTTVSSPPTIDGTINAGEWVATPVNVTFGNIPATVRFEQTATALYIGVVVQDLAPGAAPELTAYFDNTHNGAKDLGDDAWLSFVGQPGSDFFYSATGGASHYNDTTTGGTNDTTASATGASGNVTFEIRHPLCSPDTAHDMCASPGQTVGIDFQYEPGPLGVIYDAPGPNAFDPSSNWADLTLGGDTVAPSVTLTHPTAGSTLSGTVDVSADASDNVGVASVHFEYYDGGAQKFYDLGTVTGSPYQVRFDTTTVPNTAGENGTVYATVTDTSGNTFRAGNGVTVANGALSGTLTTPATLQGIDLTAAGTQDWAVWGYAGGGSSTALSPDVRKAGGSAISALSGSPPAPAGGVRPFGGDPANPYSFNWGDGDPVASATGAKTGLTDPASGFGVSFTVPADTATRTLTLWTSAHYADGVVSATLSDASAPAYSATLSAVQGQFTNLGENVPGVFRLRYSAASAGQHLTVTWTQTANNGCGGCDDVVLYAAALDGPSAGLTADASVGMSGANVPISGIPLRVFEKPAAGTTAAPINGLPINGLPINGLPINGLPINGLPINGLPINGLPINGLPINGLPINGLPINGLPINGLPINGLPINGLPINGLPINGLPINGLPLNTPGGWQALLAGTALAGLPLQSITLGQVLALQPRPPQIKLGDLDVSLSQLGNETIGALALGSAPINGLGLSPDALAALQQWCQSAATTATACSTGLGNYSLFALGLAGAPINGLPINGLPINGLPINGLPINGLPINGLALSASPINGLPINGLPINGLPLGALPINGLPAGIVDCTLVDCGASAGKTLSDAATAGAILPGATLGLLPDGSLTIGQLLQSLLAPGSPYATTLTLGDVTAMLIRRADVPWETLDPRLLSVFDPQRPQLHLHAGFSLSGTVTASDSVRVTVTLPAGFDVALGSSALRAGGGAPSAVPDPAVDASSATWSLTGLTGGASYMLDFAASSGTHVGLQQAKETVTAAGLSVSHTASFAVTDSYEPNGDASSPDLPAITPNTAVQMAAISAPGDVDYYRIPMPPAGTRLHVHLTNLPADFDLALYSSATTSVRSTSTSTSSSTSPPLQDGVVPDQRIDLQGGTNPQLAPTALQDVPDPGIPLVQVSANRGTDAEDVGMVSPGGGGYVVVAVYGYNAAWSTSPYSLRVTTQAPQTFTCAARTFPNAGLGIAGTVPAIASLPSDLNTLILVNEKRIGDTYGTTGENSVVAALTRLAGDRSLGVSGAVVPVEGLAQAQFDTWDANPCDVAAANAVANPIADEVAAVKAARPTLKYVVFAGGDDQIPFFRIPDLSLIANETGFAGSFGRNEYFGALASGNLLTDNPYLDTRPVPASGRQLFIPNLVGGRLVEKPAQIAGAVSRFESSNGTLNASSAFVSGYDFVADGSRAVAANLSGLVGSSLTTLIGDTWSKSMLLASAFPTSGPAAINDWNGHYDNHQALAANGDQTNLLSTADLTGPYALSGGIFFTMGCHAGFQTTDAIVGASAPDALDWSEYFAGTGTGFVGNTGFGLGNTDSVAFSEELMADFGADLRPSLSIGQALTRAKQDYFLARTAFSSYDEKTLSEAELYGLPMYGVGVAPAPVGAAPPPPAPSTGPVRGSTASTSPNQGTLVPLQGSNAQVAPFAVSPDFGTERSDTRGDYFTNGGQVQAPNYRPLQPFVTLPATRSGLVAHGVLVDALTSNDVPNFNPDNVRPTVDLSVNEPEPQFADQAWPEKIPSLVSLDDGAGVRQSLNLATGQFFTDQSSHTGVERQWTQVAGRVTYSTSPDFVPPTVDSIDAFVSNGTVSFSGRFSDRTETGAVGTLALAQVVYDVDNGGTWRALPLRQDASTGLWSGGATFSGTHVQYFVEACDAAGNCGFSSNKGRYFDAQPLPAATGSLALTPDRQPDAGGTWYTRSVAVTATGPTNVAVAVSIDGGPFTHSTDAVTLGGGVHTIEARGSDGSDVTRVFLVDTQAPTITHALSPAAPDGTNGWYKSAPTVTFTCADDVSGVAAGSCVVSGTASNQFTLSQSATPQTVTATATDNVGNGPTSDSASGLKVDLSPPTAPTFTGVQSGMLYAVNDLPPASAFGCASTDQISGLAGCTVSGYGTSIGSHTLTATATDNAGNTSTSTLTYVVGFQAGNVLPPVTAPGNDQGDPAASDLQAFRIKSTIPVKFRMWLDAAKTTMMTAPPAGSIARLTFGKYNSNTSTTDSADLISAAADSGNVFRWTGSPDYQYIYNLQTTTSQSAGEYYVRITLYASDGTTILAQSAKQYFILRS